MDNIGTAILIFLAIETPIVALYTIVYKYAVDSMSELRYYLKCVEDLRESVALVNGEEKTLEVLDETIEQIEKQLQTHWGRKIAKGRKGIFDYTPTPKEFGNF